MKSILVAEDHDFNYLLIERFLSRSGFAVDRALNGMDALESTREQHYDLVLMDIEMPKLDGLDATRQIRKRERNEGLSPVPIIALTAHSEDGDRERCMEAGCSGYLAKPIEKAKLLEAVAALLEKAR